jgi:hypothetical protein
VLRERHEPGRDPEQRDDQDGERRVLRGVVGDRLVALVGIHDLQDSADGQRSGTDRDGSDDESRLE